MKYATKLIIKLDFVGVQLKPTLNGSNRIQSVFGGFISLIVTLLIAFGFGYFSLSIIRRDKPIMNVIENKVDNLAVSLKKNPLMVIVADKFGRLVHNDPEFQKAVQLQSRIHVTRPAEQGQSLKLSMYAGKLKSCEEKDFDPEVWENVSQLGISPNLTLCIDPETMHDMEGNKYTGELQMLNKYGDVNSDFLVVSVNYCNEEQNPGCREYTNKAGILTTYVYRLNYFLNQSDFENPVKPDITSYGFHISDKFSQTVIFYTKVNEIMTDKSLFLTETESQTYYNIDGIVTNVGVFEEERKLSLELVLTNNNIVTINERRYLKIPEMLANVGGFMKVALLIGNMLAYWYSQYVCLVNIVKLETNYKSTGNQMNNFIKKGNSISTSKNPIIVPSKPVEGPISFKKYLTTLVSKADKPVNHLRYLELNYLIEKLVFIEELKRVNKLT